MQVAGVVATLIAVFLLIAAAASELQVSTEQNRRSKRLDSEKERMPNLLRLSLVALLPALLPTAAAYGRKTEPKTGTIVYAQFSVNQSDSALYFYLNDADNDVVVLYPSNAPFTGCDQFPCLNAQMDLLSLRVKCTRVSASPFCAVSADHPYILKDHKGIPAIEIGFGEGEMGWVEMPVRSIPASTLRDTFVDRVAAYDQGWKPATATAWNDESQKLLQHFGQMKEQEARTQFACLTHLKIGDPVATLGVCGVTEPFHTNSDLRGEQRVYHITVWGGGLYVGFREVLVYVNTEMQTIENVQWDDKIHGQ